MALLCSSNTVSIAPAGTGLKKESDMSFIIGL